MAANKALIAMVSASMNKSEPPKKWTDRDNINPNAFLWSMDNFWGDFDLWITSAIIGGLQQEVVISMSEDKMRISISDEFYRVRKMEASRFDIEALIDEAKEMRKTKLFEGCDIADSLMSYDKRLDLLRYLITRLHIKFDDVKRCSLLQWCPYKTYVDSRRQLKLRIDKALSNGESAENQPKSKKPAKDFCLMTYLDDKITYPGLVNNKFLSKTRRSTWASLRQTMIGGSQRSKEDWEKKFQLSDGKNMNALMELGFISFEEHRFDDAADKLSMVAATHMNGQRFGEEMYFRIAQTQLAKFWRIYARSQLFAWYKNAEKTRLNAALQAYQTALKHLVNVVKPALWLEIGVIYMQFGAFEAAAETFGMVMAKFPSYYRISEVVFLGGTVFKHMQMFDKAAKHFQFCLDRAPSPYSKEDVLFALARVNQQRGQEAQSKEQLTNCFALVKKKGEIDRNLFHSWESWSEQDQAWKYFGSRFSGNGDHILALDCYQQMTQRMGTRMVSSWLLLGVAQQMTNQKAQAIESFKQASRLDSENVDVKEMLQKAELDEWSSGFENGSGNVATKIQAEIRAHRQRAISVEKASSNSKARKVEPVEELLAAIDAKKISIMDMTLFQLDELLRHLKVQQMTQAAAAKKIQSLKRIQATKKGELIQKVQRRELTTMLEKRRQRSVKRINARARGYLVRKKFAVDSNAARTIQRYGRGHMGRNRVKVSRTKKTQDTAATVIQRHLRGRNGRKQMSVRRKEQKEMINEMQREWQVSDLFSDVTKSNNMRQADVWAKQCAGYLDSSQSSFRQYWLKALKAAQSLMPARNLRKLVTLITTRVAGVSEEEAFCALAEMKGNVQNAVDKLFSERYVQEMSVVCRVIRVADYMRRAGFFANSADTDSVARSPKGKSTGRGRSKLPDIRSPRAARSTSNKRKKTMKKRRHPHLAGPTRRCNLERMINDAIRGEGEQPPPLHEIVGRKPTALVNEWGVSPQNQYNFSRPQSRLRPFTREQLRQSADSALSKVFTRSR